jgi:putative ABC transport system permease protein
MLLNYLKLAFRLLLRNPFFTFINVLSLSVAFAAFYILWPYTQSELKSDQFHNDYENIASLSWQHRWTDNNQNWNEFDHALNFCGIGKRIADEFSDVKDFTRLVPQRDFAKSSRLAIGSRVFITIYQSDSTKKSFREEKTAFADPNFFQFFSFPLQSGDPAKVLSAPGSVVISQQHSIKYFGHANPINSVIYLNDSIPYTIRGIFNDLPRNTHFNFEVVMTTAGIDDIDHRFVPDDGVPDWIGANYVKVNGVDKFEDLQRKINDQRDLYGNWANSENTISLKPLKDIIFSDPPDNPFVYKSKNALNILRALSIIVLFLAWTNYVGLSITTLHKRMPEVGTRKVVGARNRDFIIQFFIESAIINFLALLFALTLVQILKSPAEYFLHFYVADWKTIIGEHFIMLVLIPVFGMIVTGTYPVLMSSKKSTTHLLKKLRTVQMPWWIKSMVTIQYASAVVLLIWIGAVYFQLNYILNKNTGINHDGILVVDCPLNQKENYNHKLDNFITASTGINGICQATLSKSVVGDKTGVPTMVKRSENGISVGLFSNGVVDENFLDLYGILLLEGRNFQANSPADKNSVLLSNRAIDRLGFSSPKEAVGSKINLPGYDQYVEIIGVYKEYEFEPLFAQAQQKGHGSILTYKNSLSKYIKPSKISFKISLENATSIITRLEELYKTTFTQDIFKWTFLDQNINRHYAQEQIVRNQIMLFTLLAIGIACLGLLGTTTNKVIEKTKEIGIRKVLGAQMHQIAQIILNTASTQVIIAIVIGIPLAYYLVQTYLERYSERLSFEWWHYALPVALLLLIMFVTIAGVLLKAARTNPVESLRSE